MAHHSEYAKLIRNSDEIHKRWKEPENESGYDNGEIVGEMSEVLVI